MKTGRTVVNYGPHNLDELILRIHASVLDPRSWLQTVGEIRNLIGADRAVLHNPTAAGDYWRYQHGLDSGELEAYSANWAAQDLWVDGAFKRGKMRTGCVQADDDLVERNRFLGSPFFNEFLRTYDMDRMMCVCLQEPLPHAPSALVTMAFMRVCSEPGFSQQQVELLRRVTPHLVVAVSNFQRSRALALKSRALSSAADSVNAPLFGVDRRGKLVFANAAGDAELRSARWLRLVNSELVAGKGTRAAPPIRTLLQQLQRGVSGALLLKDARSAEVAILTTAPVHDAAPSSADSPIIGFAWVIRSAPARKSVLAQLFALTPAEEQLIGFLGQGLSLSEIAARRGSSIHTVRSQIKTIFRKTGQRTQAQLATLAVRAQLLGSSAVS
jgi:DNA-binding CsgD family transcriptional regulator